MARVSKFTDQQKLEIVLDLLSGKASHNEVCRKYDISSACGYKLKDRALDILRQQIGRPPGRPSGEVEQLHRKVADLEQLAGDQALAIRFKKKSRPVVEVTEARQSGLSVRRPARAFDEPVSSVGRWVAKRRTDVDANRRRKCPVSGDEDLRARLPPSPFGLRRDETPGQAGRDLGVDFWGVGGECIGCQECIVCQGVRMVTLMTLTWDFNGPFVWAGLCFGVAVFLPLLMWFAYTRRGEQMLEVFWRLLHGRYLLGSGEAPGGEIQPWMLWVVVGICLVLAAHFAAKGWGIL